MNLEDDILIENFLRGNLSEKEKEDFLIKLKIDSDFNEKFLFEKELFETYSEDEWNSKNLNPELVKEYKELFQNSETQQLKTVIDKVQNKFQESPKKKVFTKRIIYLSAAMIALLFTVYTLIPKSISNQDLYFAYIQKDKLPSLISRSTNETDLVIGQEYFENKNYKESLRIFKKEFENSNVKNANIYLYIGISQIELNQFENAENTFDLLINSDLIDAPKGKWYKALLYLKNNQTEKTKRLLQEIVNEKSFNYILAEKLLIEIDN